VFSPKNRPGFLPDPPPYGHPRFSSADPSRGYEALDEKKKRVEKYQQFDISTIYSCTRRVSPLPFFKFSSLRWCRSDPKNIAAALKSPPRRTSKNVAHREANLASVSSNICKLFTKREIRIPRSMRARNTLHINGLRERLVRDSRWSDVPRCSAVFSSARVDFRLRERPYRHECFQPTTVFPPPLLPLSAIHQEQKKDI